MRQYSSSLLLLLLIVLIVTYVTQVTSQTTTCNGVSSTNALVCNGQGTCANNDLCYCNDGYIGSVCDIHVETTALGASSNSPGKTCFEVHRANPTFPSGVYWINPTSASGQAYRAYCDMDDKDENGNAGWTVIQRRESATVSFNQNLATYKAGFGNLAKSFWLGNDKLNTLTTLAGNTMMLRVDLNHKGKNYKANYGSFSVGTTTTNYRLAISGYSYGIEYYTSAGFRVGDVAARLDKCGNRLNTNVPGDSLTVLNGLSFSTPDSDKDTNANLNLASAYGAGWWWASSVTTNLNGIYKNGTYASVGSYPANGIVWNGIDADMLYSVPYVDMKVRRNSYTCINRTMSCSGNGVCNEMDACTCDTGFFGTSCLYRNSQTCSGIAASSPNVCSGRGVCYGQDRCDCTLGYGGDECQLRLELGSDAAFPGKHCFHIHRANRALPSGLYWINPTGASNGAFQVFCDMDDKDNMGNAGWTVFQRREGSTSCYSFNQIWQNYKFGFGNLTTSFWLGNQYLNTMTSTSTPMELQIDLLYKDKNYKAKYYTFSVNTESNNYKLSIGGYSYDSVYWVGNGYYASTNPLNLDAQVHQQLDACGRIVDGLSPADGMSGLNTLSFSTYDDDNDPNANLNLASVYGAGWWWPASVSTNLNGIYKNGTYPSVGSYPANGIIWPALESNSLYSAPYVAMKIRPRAFNCKNRTVSCSGHGDCDAYTDLVIPANTTAWSDKCICDAGFIGDNCADNIARTCNGLPFNNKYVCSSRGECVGQDICKCKLGAGGKYCEKMYQLGEAAAFSGRDCFHIHRANPVLSSGIYWINPKNVTNGAFQVYCDMDDKDEFGYAGWTVVQRREPSTSCFSFNQNWINYRDGFGPLTGSYWLGNEKIYQISTTSNYELRVDLEFKGIAYKANYNSFSLATATNNYRLTIGGYSYDKQYWIGGGVHVATNPLNMDSVHPQLNACGQTLDGLNPKDGMSGLNTLSFSTPDNDNDPNANLNLASAYGAGWWWPASVSTNLNGIYKNGTYPSVGSYPANGIVWPALDGDSLYSSKYAVMKIRPRAFNCKNRTVSCSGHGDCDRYTTLVTASTISTFNDKCSCDLGFFEADCSDNYRRTCNGLVFNSPYACSGKGSCYAYDKCKCKTGYGGEWCEKTLSIGTDKTYPGRNCFHIHRSNPSLPSGIYWVNPKNVTNGAFQVDCDMDDKDQNGYAGWTVIQRRESSTSCFNFNQNWVNYRDGFGNLATSHWVGNEKIYQLTSSGTNLELRVDMQYGTNSYKANYYTFSVNTESNNYKLSIGGYSYDSLYWVGDGFHIATNPLNLDKRVHQQLNKCGAIRDGMNPQDGMSGLNTLSFSTYDDDNDPNANLNLASAYGAGWWWPASVSTNLNGIYRNGAYSAVGSYPYNGVIWPALEGNSLYSIPNVVMKVRPNTYNCKNRTESCSGHGDCDILTDWVDLGHMMTWHDMCVCDENKGYFGPNCEDRRHRSCDGIDANSTCACNGNGQCVAQDKCVCNLGFGGMYCDKELALGTDPTFPGKNCFHIHRANTSLPSGVYWITTGVGSVFQVSCDMDDKDYNGYAGWTVMQRREGSTSCYNFNQHWTNYRDGFGNLTTSHWLGNEKVYRMTSSASVPYELRVDFAYKALNYTANYYTFSLATESNNYRLSIGGFSYDKQYWIGSGYYSTTNPLALDSVHQQISNCGAVLDGLTPTDGMSGLNTLSFSTTDDDNDPNANLNLALAYGAGWWWPASVSTNLNGIYKNGTYPSVGSYPYNGIIWPTLESSSTYSLLYTDMKLRPRSFNCKNRTMSCSGHGDCSSYTKEVTPQYISNYVDACTCDPGYFGPTCADNIHRQCNSIAFNDTTYVCSSHGDCIAQDQCKCKLGYGGQWCQSKLELGTDKTFPAINCFQIHRANPSLPSGVYWLRVSATTDVFRAYCDMDDKDMFGQSGWTVIQKRESNSSCYNFNQNWIQYRDGFGALEQSHWLGNEKIYNLTLGNGMELRVDLLYKNTLYKANYQTFSIATGSNGYRLTIGDYSYDTQYWVSAGMHSAKNPLGLNSVQADISSCGNNNNGNNPVDGMSGLNTLAFSTWDADKDPNANLNLASAYGAGWWWPASVSTNLNGIYRNGAYSAVGSYPYNGVIWPALEGNSLYSIPNVAMKIRPKTFSCKNRTVSCSGHGDCDRYTSLVSAETISTFSDACVCDAGFFGPTCADNVHRQCNGTAANSQSVCSGHGVCSAHDVCTCTPGYDGTWCQSAVLLGQAQNYPGKSCFDINRANPSLPSGVYWINPTPTTISAFQVYCDMDDKDNYGVAGWTVFQRRESSTSCFNFNQPWANYAAGFGDMTTSFWLGNDKLSALTATTGSPYELRVDMLYKDSLYKANYRTFAVAAKASNYRITVSGFSYEGTLNPKDGMSGLNTLSFSTWDADKDPNANLNLASAYGAGWWWPASVSTNLNGIYRNGAYSAVGSYPYNGVIWPVLESNSLYSIPYVVMKVRPQAVTGMTEYNCKNRTLSCSGHGYCNANDACTCDNGYSGTTCTVVRTCAGKVFNDASVCSGHGVCSDENTCTCNAPYFGVDCSSIRTCSAIVSTNPSVCSGHGKCVDQDTCICDNNYNATADCSVPVCFGIAGNDASVCGGHGTCESPDHCVCQTGYSGETHCEYPICYKKISTDPSVCGGNGVCTAPNVCQCSNGYAGTKCSPVCSSNCNKNGQCIAPEICACSNGFSGADCNVTRTCHNITFNDANVCSGRGVCVDENICNCADGYAGTNCELNICFSVTSDEPAVCSGNGDCIAPDTCLCDAGHNGTCCGEARICGGILFTDPMVCAGHGKCVAEDICECEPGFNGQFCGIVRTCGGISFENPEVCSGKGQCLAGDSCSCNSGYKGSLCTLPICYGKVEGDTGVCSGHGTCTAPNTCQCDDGYLGNTCQYVQCFDKNTTIPSSTCSAHGTCTAPDTCNCNSGYTGDQCDNILCNGKVDDDPAVCNARGVCVSPNQCSCNATYGYTGSDCHLPICYGSYGSSACSGHGTCTSPDNCKCNIGYLGTACEIPVCYGKNSTDSSVCSGNGDCILYNRCQCNSQFGGSECSIPKCYGTLANNAAVCSGHGSCNSPNNCTCNNDWVGSSCSLTTCFDILSNNASVCSGHGSCVNKDTCSCSAGYAGANCSQIVCYGKYPTDPSVCSNSGDCIGPNTCQCDTGYTGANCNVPICYGIVGTASSACSAHGSCVAADTCLCNAGYTGTSCSIPICFGYNATDINSCSGHGSCTKPDTCTCSAGYIGSKCETLACFGIANTSSSVCSGHGRCDGPNHCSCDAHWSGSTCSITTCFSVTNNNASVCSGHGSCVAYDTCSCTSGYSGPNCNLNLCFGKNSSDPSVCSGNGTCVKPDTCSCSAGYIGSNCDTIACSGIASSNSTNVCSGYGRCDAPDHCTCQSGYTGATCGTKLCFGLTDNNPLVCSGHGSCSDVDNCTCSSGYTGNDCSLFQCFGFNSTDNRVCSSKGLCYAPNKCSCAVGAYGSDCSITGCFGVSSNASNVCSSHGTCTGPDVCVCGEHYSGSDCSATTCYGISSSNVTVVCSGHGDCASFDQCSCSSGYSGSTCDMFSCDSLKPSDPNVCSGKGSCVGLDNCNCQVGFYGDNCQYSTCDTVAQQYPVCSGRGNCSADLQCTCPEHYSGPTCAQTTCGGISSSASNVCSSHGKCVAYNQCSCSSGYTGVNCSVPICYGISNDNSSNVCSGNGICSSPNKCTCKDGYTGTQCNVPICYGKKQNDYGVCSNHGDCSSPNNCTCDEGYGGFDCRSPVCFGFDSFDPLVCSWNGDCIAPNFCNCHTGFTGRICDTPVCYHWPASDVAVCNAHGNCTAPDVCVCEEGYGPPDCAGPPILDSPLPSESVPQMSAEESFVTVPSFSENAPVFSSSDIQISSPTVVASTSVQSSAIVTESSAQQFSSSPVQTSVSGSEAPVAQSSTKQSIEESVGESILFDSLEIGESQVEDSVISSSPQQQHSSELPAPSTTVPAVSSINPQQTVLESEVIISPVGSVPVQESSRIPNAGSSVPGVSSIEIDTSDIADPSEIIGDSDIVDPSGGVPQPSHEVGTSIIAEPSNVDVSNVIEPSTIAEPSIIVEPSVPAQPSTQPSVVEPSVPIQPSVSQSTAQPSTGVSIIAEPTIVDTSDIIVEPSQVDSSNNVEPSVVVQPSVIAEPSVSSEPSIILEPSVAASPVPSTESSVPIQPSASQSTVNPVPSIPLTPSVIISTEESIIGTESSGPYTAESSGVVPRASSTVVEPSNVVGNSDIAEPSNVDASNVVEPSVIVQPSIIAEASTPVQQSAEPSITVEPSAPIQPSVMPSVPVEPSTLASVAVSPALSTESSVPVQPSASQSPVAPSNEHSIERSTPVVASSGSQGAESSHTVPAESDTVPHPVASSLHDAASSTSVEYSPSEQSSVVGDSSNTFPVESSHSEPAISTGPVQPSPIVQSSVHLASSVPAAPSTEGSALQRVVSESPVASSNVRTSVAPSVVPVHSSPRSESSGNTTPVAESSTPAVHSSNDNFPVASSEKIQPVYSSPVAPVQSTAVPARSSAPSVHSSVQPQVSESFPVAHSSVAPAHSSAVPVHSSPAVPAHSSHVPAHSSVAPAHSSAPVAHSSIHPHASSEFPVAHSSVHVPSHSSPVVPAHSSHAPVHSSAPVAHSSVKPHESDSFPVEPSESTPIPVASSGKPVVESSSDIPEESDLVPIPSPDPTPGCCDNIKVRYPKLVTSTCVGKYDNDPIRLSATLSNPGFFLLLQYQWVDSNGRIIPSILLGNMLVTPNLYPTKNTNYTVRAKLWHKCAVPNVQTLSQVVNVYVAPRPKVTAPSCITYRKGYDTQVKLEATVTADKSFTTSFNWKSQSGTTFNAPTVYVTPNAQRTSEVYTAKLTYSRSCFVGGTVSDTTTIKAVDVSCGKNKVYLCQVPPGNPRNAKTICISSNGVQAHLNTGSYIGQCGYDYDSCPCSR
jgi:hypothetical protein